MLNLCAEQFIELLKAKGLNFQSGPLEGTDALVEVPYQGKIYKMFFTGENGTYLSIYNIFESVPTEKVADVIFACNELNTHYKWVTFFVNDSNDVILHDDAILAAENCADESFELMVRIMKIGEEVKPTLMKAIYS